MVYYTCNHCGESLQKPKVAKHYQFHCRKYPDLTCVDCHKDFRGDEYVQHTKCITENERYGGANYVAKPNSNKGEKKQNEWIDIVQNVLNNDKSLTVPERNFLNQISHNSNIPRKKPKFLNFIKSSMGNRANWQIVESVWDKIENTFKQNKSTTSNKPKEQNGSSNGNAENISMNNENNENLVKESEQVEDRNGGVEKKKKKKRKLETNDDSISLVENVENNEVQDVVEKKKKSKKIKLENHSSECITVDLENESTKNNGNAVEEKMEKKKKSKKRKLENMEVCTNNENEKNGNAVGDLEGITEKKKKTKKVEAEIVELENEVDKTGQEEVGEKKKKKKNKQDNVKDIDNSVELKVIKSETSCIETTTEIKNEDSKCDKFDWKKVITEVITDRGVIGISPLKLQKKVVGRYIHSHEGKNKEKAIAKFEKVLKKMDNITVENEIVKLVEN